MCYIFLLWFIRPNELEHCVSDVALRSGIIFTEFELSVNLSFPISSLDQSKNPHLASLASYITSLQLD